MIYSQADIPSDIHTSSVCVNDNLLLYAGADYSLVVWNMDSQKELGRLVGHDQQIRAVAVRGNMAVSAQVAQDEDGPPRLWNLETMQCTATVPDMPNITYTCCIEGKVLLGSAAAAGQIKLWDIAASAPVALPDLVGHTAFVSSIKASASTVLSGSGDRTVRLWDLRTGKCERTMEGHTRTVWSVDMDGHCRTAVSGSDDQMVKLWDLGSGRCSATLEGNSGLVRDVVMHESGSSFLSSGFTDLTVNAWAVSSSKACMRADFKAFFPTGNTFSRLFANRDLSTVVYCGVNTGTRKLELRLWR